MGDSIRQINHMPERIPATGTFELTVRCNLHCKMCMFRHDDSENAELLAKEQTAEQWIDMARQVAEAGTLDLLITGGEPMLRQDFCEIWKGIYKYGFITTLYTNATLLTADIMETLRKYPPHRIGVTIYGASPETYEKVTGNAKAFEKCIEGIKQLKTLPSIMEYRMTVIKDNFEDVDAVEELLHKEIDPDARLINTRMVFKAVRGGCADVGSCRISPEKNIYLQYRRAINRLRDKIGDEFDIQNVKLALIPNDKTTADCKKERYSLFGCDAGMNAYTVSWDRKLLGCQMMGRFFVEIKNDFCEAWKLFPASVDTPLRPEKCLHCQIQQYCSSCPASLIAEMDNGGDIDYICKDTETEFNLIYFEEGRK